MQHTPLEALPITGRRSEQPWAALTASIAAHAGVIALLLLAFGRRPETPKTAASEAEPERTETVVLTPPTAPRPPARLVPKPEPKPEPVRRSPPRDRPIPRPQVARGPENIPLLPPTPTPDPPTPSAPEPDAGKSPGSAAPPPAEVAATAFDADTRRLFGRHDTGDPGGGATPQPVIRWNGGPTEPRDNDCTPRPRPPQVPGQPVTLEFVEGWVYNERTGAVLAGAHLQMMGTPYSAFADNAGHYRLGFDQSLVDECRSQYVRVIAPGVPPQLIVLGRGPGGTNIYLRP